MDEHAATIDIAKQSLECPVMATHCPYAKNKTFDISAIKKHAAFTNGCPYKHVDTHKLQECPAFKDGKCPFDGNHTFDMSKLHECPAFKNGCPYTKLEAYEKHDHSNLTTEHSATEHIASEASKCPVFAHSNNNQGCPFDPAHPHSLDMSKISMCPAFQKNGGKCPYKDVHLEKLSECPAFKDGKCPFDGTKTVDMSKIKECPAFQKGCPYSHLHAGAEDTTTHTVVVNVSQQARKCPIFAQKNGGCPYDPVHLRHIDLSKTKQCPEFQKHGGCPYKKMKLEKIDQCPAFKEGKCPFDKAETLDLSRVHECPAFKSGCPYKETHATQTQTATTETTPSSSTTTTTTTTAPAGHPAGDAAKCPFHAMHGKVDNPHK